jgi:hypothetical protein
MWSGSRQATQSSAVLPVTDRRVVVGYEVKSLPQRIINNM